MKDAAVALLVAVAVLVIGAAVFFTTPSLQSRATRDAAQADLLAETARRQLGRYQPSLALVKAFLPDADWTAATAQPDPEAITRQVQDNARYIEQVDQVLRDLNTAYDAARSSVPQGSRDLMLAWGFPEPLIEDAFHFAGESGKRADQYRQRLRGNLPPTPDPRLSGLGAGPTQQSRALRGALQRVSAQYAANHKLLDDAAGQLNRALRLLPNHVAANRLLAMVEFQRALQNRFEGLGLRRLAERYRPRLVELAATAQALKARADAVHNQRNIQLTLDQLDQPDRQLRARIDRQRDMVSQLQAELTARTQQVEALRAAARQARRDYEDALHASYDPDVPSAFADHLRNLQQAGRTMSAAAAQLEAAEQGTVVGVRLDPPGDLLAGRYLPAPGASQGEYLPGLAAISRQLAIEQTRLERTQAALQDLATRSDQLQQLRTHLAEELERYDSQLAARLGAAAKKRAESFALPQLAEGFRQLLQGAVCRGAKEP